MYLHLNNKQWKSVVHCVYGKFSEVCTLADISLKLQKEQVEAVYQVFTVTYFNMGSSYTIYPHATALSGISDSIIQNYGVAEMKVINYNMLESIPLKKNLKMQIHLEI